MSLGILLIGNHPPPYGGVPTHIESVAAYLVRYGWRVHVLSLKYRSDHVRRHDAGYALHSPTRSGKLAKAAMALRHADRLLRSPRLGLGAPAEFLRALELWQIGRRILAHEQIDVISAYHVFPSGLVGAWLSRAFSVSLVTTIFGEIYAEPRYFRRRARDVRYVFRASRRLLSCSKHCAQSAGLIDPGRYVEVVYYGVDTGRFSPRVDGTVVRTALGMTSSDKVVLFLARMDREMGLDVLLRAIPQVLAGTIGVKFLLAGRRGELEPAARALTVSHPGAVLVVPEVPADILPAYYAASTLVVAPSISARACLGLSIAEAMATGKPVIGTTIGGGPEILRGGENGILVPPQDDRALATAIRDLLNDPGRCARFGEHGRELAVTSFNAERTNLTMEAIFLDARQ